MHMSRRSCVLGGGWPAGGLITGESDDGGSNGRWCGVMGRTWGTVWGKTGQNRGALLDLTAGGEQRVCGVQVARDCSRLVTGGEGGGTNGHMSAVGSQSFLVGKTLQISCLRNL